MRTFQTVVDAKTGAGISSFELALHGQINAKWEERSSFRAADFRPMYGPDGRFSIEDLNSPSSYGVVVRAPGYAALGRRVRLRPGSTPRATFSLEKGWGWLRVVDPEENPIEEARVRVGKSSGTTDQEGRYYVDVIPGSADRVYVAHPGYLETVVEIPEFGDENVDRVIYLNQGSIIEGQVTYAGTPLADQPIYISGPSGERVETDAEGWYRQTGLESGQYALKATIEVDGLGFTIERSRTLAAGEIWREDFAISESNAGVKGQVHSRFSSPPYFIFIGYPDTTIREWRFFGETDEQGYFSFDHLPPGDVGILARYEQRLSGETIPRTHEMAIRLVEGQVIEQDLQFDVKGFAHGYVSVPEDVASIYLGAVPGSINMDNYVFESPGYPKVEGAEHNPITPGEGGLYRIHFDTLGPYTVFAVATFANGSTPPLVVSAIVQVEQGSEIELDFNLRP